MQSMNPGLIPWTYPGRYCTMGSKGEAGQRTGIPCHQAKGDGKASVANKTSGFGILCICRGM